MKKLQNHFTTPEQSKRLLKIGVPADSADLFYFCRTSRIPQVTCEYVNLLAMDDFLPCWSDGRIAEIMYLCDKEKVPIEYYDLYPLKDGVSPVEQMIDILEYTIKMNDIDFSKLEE